ncbi:patatin-like phospholipase family protein [Massilia sp. DD77]|uniref:patatin-like phospholipase family protein n=1 Tax=Massilia sp. DD77 TaxID=3109349 RepID=UPI003000881D
MAEGMQGESDRQSTDDASPLEKLVRERREHLGENGTKEGGLWGLALSGGGVRSATFCYGLVTALARKKRFARFDLMSTVSGGGYIGSMIGRMAQDSKDAAELQTKLSKQNDSEEREWLRANSRYLIPRGSRDWLFGAATFVRNLLGIHLELGMVFILLGCALGAIDLLVWSVMDSLVTSADEATRTTALRVWRLLSPFPTLWPLVLFPLGYAAIYSAMYWHIPPRARNPRYTPDSVSYARTQHMANGLSCATAILVLGAVDWIAWRIANRWDVVAALAAVFAIVLPLLRALLPKVQQGGSGSQVARMLSMSTMIDVTGRFAVFALAIFWTTVVHTVATRHAVGDLGRTEFAFAASLLGFLALFALSWMAMTARRLDFLNMSSLHHFYRSRLTSTYLGAANAKRRQETSGQGSSVKGTHPDDDAGFGQYAPHTTGGPVHLLNVCINQTFQRHGLFNIDRQGELMTVVGPGHVRIERQRWKMLPEEAKASLGTWMAISGAAAAPGMGSGSRPGWAALLTTLGIRLGYWWDSRETEGPMPRLGRWAPKYRYLVLELLGQLPGSSQRIQYLSDGGHCENTGIYPLLRERCKLIVAADCGADPEYRFDDLENLLRRARIDLGVTISFVRHEDIAGLPSSIGTLDDIVLKTSKACIAPAIIDYGESLPPTQRYGVLVLVKPTLTANLPEDIYNYYRDNRSFPQQSTADQFFSEDQWESYFALGEHIGRNLDGVTLAKLEKRFAGPDAGAAMAADPELRKPATPGSARERSPLRVAAGTAAGATLGIGTLLTIASSLGVAFFQSTGGQEEKGLDPATLRPLFAAHAALRTDKLGQTGPEAARLAADVVYVWRAAKTLEMKEDLLANPQAVAVFKDAAEHCYPMRTVFAACASLYDPEDNCPRPLRKMTDLERRYFYWLRSDVSLRDSRPASYCELAADAARSTSSTIVGPPATAAGTGRPPLQEPGVPSPASSASSPSAGAQQPVCTGVTIYIQTYGSEGREQVQAMRDKWRQAGAKVPPVEDMNLTAQRRGRNPPLQVGEPTVRYHGGADLAGTRACAAALARLVGRPHWKAPEPLAPSLKPTNRTVEVWLPSSELERDPEMGTAPAAAAAAY